MTTDDKTQEILGRARRIETRLTQLMIGLGINTEGQRPRFEPGRPGRQPKLFLPSPHTSMKEIHEALPEGWTGAVELYVGTDHMGALVRH